MRIHARMPVTDLFPEWMRRPGVPMLLGNELRAVLPIFLSAFALIAVSCALPEDVRGTVALIVCAFASAAISGIAFGHDFTHRTLLATLAQPVSRDDIWKTRLRIATGATVVLSALAALPVGVYQHIANIAFGGMRFWVPPGFLLLITMSLAAICIAPFLRFFVAALWPERFSLCAYRSFFFTAAITFGVLSSHPISRAPALSLFSCSLSARFVSADFSVGARFGTGFRSSMRDRFNPV